MEESDRPLHNVKPITQTDQNYSAQNYSAQKYSANQASSQFNDDRTAFKNSFCSDNTRFR